MNFFGILICTCSRTSAVLRQIHTIQLCHKFTRINPLPLAARCRRSEPLKDNVEHNYLAEVDVIGEWTSVMFTRPYAGDDNEVCNWSLTSDCVCFLSFALRTCHDAAVLLQEWCFCATHFVCHRRACVCASRPCGAASFLVFKVFKILLLLNIETSLQHWDMQTAVTWHLLSDDVIFFFEYSDCHFASNIANIIFQDYDLWQDIAKGSKTPLIYSWRSGEGIGQHPNTQRGASNVDWNTGEFDGECDDSHEFYALHGALILLAWMVVAPYGLYQARYVCTVF